MTFCMSSRHSNQLSYAPESEDIISQLFPDCKRFFEIYENIFSLSGDFGERGRQGSAHFADFTVFPPTEVKKWARAPVNFAALLLAIRPRICYNVQ